MPIKTIIFLIVLLLAASPYWSGGQDRPATRPAGAPANSAPMEDLVFLREVTRFRSFLEDSPDVRTDPGTIGKFFNSAIYEKLRGNEFFGYTYDEGYTPPAEKTVCLRLVTTLPALKKYEPALLYVLVAGAVRAGWKPAAAAPAEIGVCLLGVDQHSRAGQAGVLLEVYMKNVQTNRARFIRFACGQGSLDDALLQAAEFLMRLAAK